MKTLLFLQKTVISIIKGLTIVTGVISRLGTSITEQMTAGGTNNTDQAKIT